MHGTEPSRGAPFGHTILSGTLVPSFDVASSRETSKPDRSTGGFGDSAASSTSAPVAGENRYTVRGVVYDDALRMIPSFQTTGLLTDDTGSDGAFAGCPVRVNARSSLGPPVW